MQSPPGVFVSPRPREAQTRRRKDTSRGARHVAARTPVLPTPRRGFTLSLHASTRTIPGTFVKSSMGGRMMTRRYWFVLVALVSLVGGTAGCGGSEPAATPAAAGSSASATPATPAASEDEPLPPSDLETRLPPAVRDLVLKPFTGDFKEMLERKAVRVGVV